MNPLDDTDQNRWKQAPHFNTSSLANIRLNGRVALVVGATGHLGRAISRAIASCGASVAIHYLTHEDEAQAIAKRIIEAGSKSIVVKANIAVSDEVKDMASTVVEKFGTIDILINAEWISPSTDPVVDSDDLG